ncbi:MAG: hypothetical protein COB67_03020 [SAR324 cluster bacterium]|uniref:Uncharacterized protein n=1 Tax=SAR324 cluster bacterium TaxID=2024889 RepID=A0A2A4TAA5_9DELT|nr:MAG: hypothetical protein COB67_03020 [SAR324 cluster bacterium]
MDIDNLINDVNPQRVFPFLKKSTEEILSTFYPKESSQLRKQQVLPRQGMSRKLPLEKMNSTDLFSL